MEIDEFEKMVFKYEKEVFSFCFYLTSNKQLAEDLYQDTIIMAFEKSEIIDKNKNTKSLLLSIAIGKWKNQKRKLFRRNKIVPMELYNEFPEEISKSDSTFEEQILKNEEKKIIKIALNQIHDKYKAVIILYYQEDYDIKHISKICKIPEGTVKSRLHKGRQLIKDILKKEGYHFE